MSTEPPTPPNEPERLPWGTILSVVGCLLIFAVLVWFLYYFSGGPDTFQAKEAGAREQKFLELRAKEKDILTTYKMVDKAKGTVRIPIDRAMELVGSEAAAQKKEADKP